MSSSGDDDDFLSADEDVCDEETIAEPKQLQEDQQLSELTSRLHCSAKPEQLGGSEQQKKLARIPTVQTEKEKADSAELSSERRSDKPKTEPAIKNNQKSVIDDDDEDQEALAERIRERNLRIAREFSAELAKSVKSLAPVPVSVHVPNEVKNLESESSSIPGATKSNLPPAPPPTPALTSSFNLEDQNGATAATSTTQFPWRIPARGREDRSSSSVKEDQPKIALDRLSETFSCADRSLFERVAEDLKKVAIKPADSSSLHSKEGSSTDPALSAISSISDLGNTLGGWGWSGATKLFNSATQVTSQVGSVLDSVVGSSQPTIRPMPNPDERDNESRKVLESHSSESPRASEVGSNVEQAGHSKNPIDVIANEPIVDFTLSAMESLGKKAFEVMTERSDTGSLQIKGIGRPWEHLTGFTKASFDEDERSAASQSASTTTDSGMLRQRSKRLD